DRLECKLTFGVAGRKRPAVNGRHAYSEQLRVHLRQSRYVAGVLAAAVVLVLGVCGGDRLDDGSQFCAPVTTRWMKPSFATTCGWIVNGYRSSRPIELLARLSTPANTSQSDMM